jgi:sulfoxide reductase catalytic subunit YedY
MKPIPSSEITPESKYISRRRFLKGSALLGASLVLNACSPKLSTVAPQPSEQPANTTLNFTDEFGDPATSVEKITGYTNFYEFTTDKTSVAQKAAGFVSSPWTVSVTGLVNKPGSYDMDDLRKKFDQEERIYRLRCVEAWSMVIPWLGFPLSKLLDEVEPTSNARYVRFETLLDPQQMPGQQFSMFSWPYVEGLRLDEAMHPLTILATGLYGKALLPQNGAPVRLVVPWKYGFKSIKSIVKIELVSEMPESFWMKSSPGEYGFYANVNPQVPHPRWSQANERRVGDPGNRKTLMMNGYESQVSNLYTNMDLQKNF